MIEIKPCAYRIKKSLEGPLGNHSLQCDHPRCEHFQKPVTYWICDACPLRSETREMPKPEPRPDLQAIENTLPPPDNVPRSFARPVFNMNGSIEYPRRAGDWEPPQDIEGWVRDNENKWLFRPLFPPCTYRHCTAFFKANCGCISIVSRCTNPLAITFGERITPEICNACPVRMS
jgi:hypothetical protein